LVFSPVDMRDSVVETINDDRSGVLGVWTGGVARV
jgi:hypothetical protein